MRLPSVLGNERLCAALDALSGRSSGALLIDGPAGSGKKTAARDIALALLCRASAPPCMECEQCARVLAGSHPDFEWHTTSGLKVDEVRALRARSFVKPSEAEFKVFVICAADAMSQQAQNALLKVLEEPQSSFFILLCEDRQSMLLTIRSRCLQLTMQPLSEAQIADALSRRVPGTDAAQRADAARRADGWLGRALLWLEDGADPINELARRFSASLRQDELARFECCAALMKLGRAEYVRFVDAASELLCGMALENADAAVRICDFLAEQRERAERNVSIRALAAALGAFCADTLDKYPA